MCSDITISILGKIWSKLFKTIPCDINLPFNLSKKLSIQSKNNKTFKEYSELIYVTN